MTAPILLALTTLRFRAGTFFRKRLYAASLWRPHQLVQIRDETIVAFIAIKHGE